MIAFTVPEQYLRLILVALNMNFDLPEPDYIFHVKETFQVVYTKQIDPVKVCAVDDFIERMTPEICEIQTKHQEFIYGVYRENKKAPRS